MVRKAVNQTSKAFQDFKISFGLNACDSSSVYFSKSGGRLVFILFTSYVDHAAIAVHLLFLEMFLKLQSNYVEVRYSPWMIDHES